MPIKYCITCGAFDMVYLENDMPFHFSTENFLDLYVNGQFSTVEEHVCIGPFSEIQPPDFPDEYYERSNCDLSPEELEMSDRVAESLSLELGG